MKTSKYLIDTCLNSQDNYEKMVNYFLEEASNLFCDSMESIKTFFFNMKNISSFYFIIENHAINYIANYVKMLYYCYSKGVL